MAKKADELGMISGGVAGFLGGGFGRSKRRRNERSRAEPDSCSIAGLVNPHEFVLPLPTVNRAAELERLLRMSPDAA